MQNVMFIEGEKSGLKFLIIVILWYIINNKILLIEK